MNRQCHAGSHAFRPDEALHLEIETREGRQYSPVGLSLVISTDINVTWCCVLQLYMYQMLEGIAYCHSHR